MLKKNGPDPNGTKLRFLARNNAAGFSSRRKRPPGRSA